MEIELNCSKKGMYEIWVDNSCIVTIQPLKGEKPDAYKQRSESEFERYVEKLKALKSGKSNKTVKKATI